MFASRKCTSIFITACCLFLFGTRGESVMHYDLWVSPSAAKILKDVPTPPNARAKAELTAARGELESFQVVIRSQGSPLKNVYVRADDLHRTGGEGRIAADSLSVQRETYVELQFPGKPILYPDGMAPNKPFDLPSNDVQPMFVTVKVPRDCPSGRYSGKVMISADGCRDQVVPINLRVLGFTLPETPSCATAFGISMKGLAHYYSKATEADLKEIYRKYYDFLLQYKVSAYDIPFDLTSKEARPYLEDPRMTSYVIPYSDDEATLRKTVGYLVENNYFKKGFFYAVDEPYTRESYDKLTEAAKRLRAIEPRYRMASPFFRGPQFETDKNIYDWMTGKLTDWIIVEDFLDKDAANRPALEKRRNAGDNTWWYVAWKPEMPYANLLVDMPGAAHRLLLWQQRREHMSGLLFWCTTYWNLVEDPWKNVQTVPDLGLTTFGDGSLLYPGESVGDSGPRSSLRLEILRDGIEDFDYFTIADSVLGPEKTEALIGNVCRSLTDWDQDPSKIDRVHKELGLAIESAIKKQLE